MQDERVCSIAHLPGLIFKVLHIHAGEVKRQNVHIAIAVYVIHSRHVAVGHPKLRPATALLECGNGVVVVL